MPIVECAVQLVTTTFESNFLWLLSLGFPLRRHRYSHVFLGIKVKPMCVFQKVNMSRAHVADMQPLERSLGVTT